MITLKAPIELKNRTDFVKDHDGFCERITGNYSLMGVEIGAEELLHIVNSPPEIYIAEGGSTTVVGGTMIASHNEEKLDIINNMLNRIMVSVDAELTYQDRAYITDALYKLGIKDDRKFMNEVFKVINDSHLEEDFINSYIEAGIERESRELRQQTLMLSREITERGLTDGLRAREESLSRQIMERLQTGAIYQIVANFNKSLTENRIERSEQLLSEQENTARNMLVQNFLDVMESEGAEIVYRSGETEAAGEGAGEGGERTVRVETSETSETIRERELSETETIRTGVTDRSLIENRTERTEQLLTEQQNISENVRIQNIPGSGEGGAAEIVYRETEGTAPEETPAAGREEYIRREYIYSSDNIYERELLRTENTERRITEEIGAAVLLDLVKNLYHTGYERISRGDTWMEFRNALYGSSDNTFNRVSYQTSESTQVVRGGDVYEDHTLAELDYTEFEELYDIQENEGNIELIEEQLREINQSNIENTSRYEQMIETLKKLKPEKKETVHGAERTRRAALTAIEDEKALLESMAEAEERQENDRLGVFREITRLFPENATQVFRVVEQYLRDPGSVEGINIASNNVAEAAEEIMRLQQYNAAPPEPEPEPVYTPPEDELVFRREERLSADEVEEILENYRRQDRRQTKEINDNTDVTETRRVNTTTVTHNTEQRISGQDMEEIAEMVNNGVRSQMGAISDQVLMKLEKRLRNEKSRRGI
ncbi:MAG: hypothetical protein K6G42_09760 [Lachnospiraceae bacterium]|nr:hypothetical protein [Lachnospiraceae bacterium]